MLAGESDFGSLWVVVGAGRDLEFVVGVLVLVACGKEWFWVVLGDCGLIGVLL